MFFHPLHGTKMIATLDQTAKSTRSTYIPLSVLNKDFVDVSATWNHHKLPWNHHKWIEKDK
jgi:hypothetical protein